VLHPDEATLVLQAVEKAREALYQSSRRETERDAGLSAESSREGEACGVSAERSVSRDAAGGDTAGASCADAVLFVAEAFLAHGSGAAPPATGCSERSAPTPYAKLTRS